LRVLLTGATGFIGSAVHTAFVRNGSIWVRQLVRQPATSEPEDPTRTFVGDLCDPASIRGACDGIDTIVHAASYVGADPTLCDRVNRQGTLHLLDEATRAGVRKVFYVSTAAVYGAGPHRGLPEDAIPPAPLSPASASRAAAEEQVRAYGGCVLRPYLIYGPRDRWFVPNLVALLRVLPHWIDGGRARLSVVNVRDLARLVAALVTRDVPPGSVYHANHPEPVTVRAAGEALARHLGVRVPGDTPAPDSGPPLPPGLPARHLQMISTDHWYDSRRVWELTGCPFGAAFPDDLADAPSWYPELAEPTATALPTLPRM